MHEKFFNVTFAYCLFMFLEQDSFGSHASFQPYEWEWPYELNRQVQISSSTGYVALRISLFSPSAPLYMETVQQFFEVRWSVQCLPGHGYVARTRRCVPCAYNYFAVPLPPLVDPLPGFTEKRVNASSTPGECKVCGAGRNATASFAATACITCFPGKFLPSLGTNNSDPSANFTDVCQDCPVGKFTDIVDASACQACFPGYISATQGLSACTSCTPGKFSDNKYGTSCHSCPIDTYAAVPPTNACHFCPLGSYADVKGLTACKNCTAGQFYRFLRTYAYYVDGFYAFYDNSGNLVNGDEYDVYTSGCLACPIGMYSAQNRSQTCTLCADGTFSNATQSTSCTACVAGTYTNRTAIPYANPPYSPSVSATTACFSCPAGTSSYARNSSSCYACPNETFAPVPASPTCLSCRKRCTGPPVSFVVQECNSTHDRICQNCTTCSAYNEFYAPLCTSRADASCAVCNTCGLGWFVRAGTCFSGNNSVCDPCPMGMFNSYNASWNRTCQTCSRGSYTSATGMSSCTLARSGFFASQLGSTAEQPCPSGSFSNATGMTFCYSCARGYFSTEASTACITCWPGAYWNASACVNCSAGTFSNETASTLCHKCSAGFFSVQGSTACSLCHAGTFSMSQSSSACRSCPAGTFNAAEGMTTCVACAAGAYSASAGATACKKCPAGFSMAA